VGVYRILGGIVGNGCRHLRDYLARDDKEHAPRQAAPSVARSRIRSDHVDGRRRSICGRRLVRRSRDDKVMEQSRDWLDRSRSRASRNHIVLVCVAEGPTTGPGGANADKVRGFGVNGPMASFVIGFDLAWSPKNATGLAVATVTPLEPLRWSSFVSLR
jgi:hypothetical protein